MAALSGCPPRDGALKGKPAWCGAPSDRNRPATELNDGIGPMRAPATVSPCRAEITYNYR